MLWNFQVRKHCYPKGRELLIVVKTRQTNCHFDQGEVFYRARKIELSEVGVEQIIKSMEKNIGMY